MDFFLRLRNQIAHRYLPALDPAIVEEAQALLLNFENTLVEFFGDASKLGGQLSVPLQLSGFRSQLGRDALRRAQALLPVDISDFLARHRHEVPDDVLRSPEYALRVFFVPVAANRQRPDDVLVNFVSAEKYPELVASGGVGASHCSR